MAEDDKQPEQFDSVPFKRRMRSARTPEDEAVVQAEWDAALMVFNEGHPPPPPAPPQSIGEIDRHFKKLFRAARHEPEREAAIRAAMTLAKTAFWADLKSREARRNAPPPPDPEAAALEAAMRAYGFPVGGGTVMGRVAASIPTPFEIHWPTVEIITKEETP